MTCNVGIRPLSEKPTEDTNAPVSYPRLPNPPPSKDRGVSQERPYREVRYMTQRHIHNIHVWIHNEDLVDRAWFRGSYAEKEKGTSVLCL